MSRKGRKRETSFLTTRRERKREKVRERERKKLILTLN